METSETTSIMTKAIERYKLRLQNMSNFECLAQTSRIERLLKQVVKKTGYTGRPLWVSDTKDDDNDLLTFEVWELEFSFNGGTGGNLIEYNPAFAIEVSDEIICAILAHEISHIINKDRADSGSQETNYQAEYQADKFAYQFYPAGSIALFQWVTAQDFGDLDILVPDHPTLRERATALGILAYIVDKR